MLKKLIDIVWPHLEGEAPIYDNFLDNETKIEDKNLDASVESARFMYDDQKSRISTIESKSSIFLGFFGTVVAILSFALKDILLLEHRELTHDAILLFGSFLIIYILQVMRYSIKSLERKGYHSFDESDFLCGDKRKTSIGLINKVKSNYDVINSKVDYMIMAHEFTKRIIGVLFVAAAALIFLSICKYIPLIPTLSVDVSPFKLDLRWSDWLLFLAVIAAIFNSVQLRRIKNKY